MGTIMDYLDKYGRYTFEEIPFGEVDSLILCQLSYLKFDEIVDGIQNPSKQVSFDEISAWEKYDRIFAKDWCHDHNVELYEKVAGSRRFCKVTLSCYENRIDLENETQFSAVIFTLQNGVPYVAFRGTDETLVGWKEDLNLAFSDPVPAQILSVKYLDYVAKHMDADFLVGGHSKGGNLAVYSSMNCSKEVRQRIKAIYDHDGPGFRPEVKAKGAFDEIKDRIQKTVPHSSVVGMILYSDEAYKVVESKSIGVAQHNPFSWCVEEEHFQIVDEIYEGRKMMDDTLNQWILSLNQEQLHAVIDTIYEVMQATGVDNLIDLSHNKKASVQKMAEALRSLDPNDVSMIMKIFANLLGRLSENTLTAVRERATSEKEKIDELLSQVEQWIKKK